MKMTRILWVAIAVVFLLAVAATQWKTGGKMRHEIKVRQVVVKANSARPDEVENARRKIEEAYKKLKQGADFKQIAIQTSEADVAHFEGDLGWVGRGVLPKRLEDVAFGLQPGQYSEIVTEIGPDMRIYRILYVEGSRNQ